MQLDKNFRDGESGGDSVGYWVTGFASGLDWGATAG